MSFENEATEQLKRELTESHKQINELLLAKEEIRHNYDLQSTLNSLLHLSLKDTSLNEILDYTLNHILSIKWLAFESRGAIFVVEDVPNTLIMKTSNELPKSIQKECSKVPFGKCLCGKAALKQEVVFASCIDKNHVIEIEGVVPHGHYCIPIISSNKTLGVINIYVKQQHRYKKKEEDFLNAIADTLAGVIERKRAEEKLNQSIQRLNKSIEGTVRALAMVVETRDPYTAGHQNRVTQLACAIAGEMKLSEEKVECIYMASNIHDIGKINVPAEILSKPSALTKAEFDLLKTHPPVGSAILKEVDFSYPIVQIILQHHERIDGSGYPEGIKGKDIMLEAKILAVADVVEAMASHRPYRPAIGIETALKEIKQNSGKLFDSEAVDACVTLFNEKEFKFS